MGVFKRWVGRKERTDSNRMVSASTFALPAILIVLVRVGCGRASEELPFRDTSRSEGGEGAELDDLRISVSRLEARLEESCQKLDDKEIYLEEREHLLKKLSEKRDSLESALSAIEGDVSMVDLRLSTLEEELRSLWATSRKNNFEIHVLKARANETDERLRVAASKVEKLAEIVSERWIQIKNFEQAQQFTEMRALDTRWDSASKRCLLLKLFYNFFGCHPSEALRMLKNIFRAEYVSSSKWGAVQQLKRAHSAVKDCHFELQSFIRREMERNEVTAALANEELVFFMASAIVVFPLLSAWIWISSLLPYTKSYHPNDGISDYGLREAYDKPF